VALSLRHGLGIKRSVERAFSAGVIFGEQEARVAELLDAAESAFARFLKTKPFWK
jgi:hypothetical protein